VWLLQLMAIEGIERAAVSRIIISTVVPRAHNFRVLASKYFGVICWWRARARPPMASTSMWWSPSRWGQTAR
jgi:hypothetical protein